MLISTALLLSMFEKINLKFMLYCVTIRVFISQKQWQQEVTSVAGRPEKAMHN